MKAHQRLWEEALKKNGRSWWRLELGLEIGPSEWSEISEDWWQSGGRSVCNRHHPNDVNRMTMLFFALMLGDPYSESHCMRIEV
jgi:hypothetical protein